jgi:hypothetical protein
MSLSLANYSSLVKAGRCWTAVMGIWHVPVASGCKNRDALNIQSVTIDRCDAGQVVTTGRIIVMALDWSARRVAWIKVIKLKMLLVTVVVGSKKYVDGAATLAASRTRADWYAEYRTISRPLLTVSNRERRVHIYLILIHPIASRDAASLYLFSMLLPTSASSDDEKECEIT